MLSLGHKSRRILKGRWSGVKVWENTADLLAHRAGRIVLPKLILPDFDNGITDVGIHYVLDTSFRGTAQTSTWYAGLIDNAGYTGVAASDTSASHAGWSELHTQYDEAARQTLSFAAAATRSITAEVSFTFNATKTVQGVFVISVSTKGGTTGTLFSTALFSSPPGLVSGNVLTANYTLSD